MKNLMTMGVLGMLLAGAGSAAAQDYDDGFERTQFGVERGYSNHNWIQLPRAPQPILDCTPRFDYGWYYGSHIQIDIQVDVWYGYSPRPVCPRRPDVRIRPIPYTGR